MNSTAAQIGPIMVGRLPTMTQEEYPGLGGWWVQLRIGPDNEEVLARVYGDSPEQAVSRADALAAPTQAEPSMPSREALVDLIAEHLSGTYHCTRVWEAWGVGTMTQDDFEDVGESGTPSEIADAVLAAALKSAQPSAPIRECCDAICGWAGSTDRMLGGIGPLCPQCGEVTELAAPAQPSAQAQAAPGMAVDSDSEPSRIIGRLLSSDPDFEDCEAAAKLISDHIEGPAGYATWKDAAVAERVRRVKAEKTAQTREPWAPFLSDRADAVKGHYAIARWNPAGYREVWNLRRHHWASSSDAVLTLDEAHALLKTATLASQPSAAAREPLTDEQIDAVAHAMPEGRGGLGKRWGYRQFARSIIAAVNGDAK